MLSRQDRTVFVVFVLIAAVAGLIAFVATPAPQTPDAKVAAGPTPPAGQAAPAALTSPRPTDRPAVSTPAALAPTLPTGAPPATDEPTALPTPLPPPTEEAGPLGPGLRLVGDLREWEEPGEVHFHLYVPRLEGDAPARTDPFNREVAAQVDPEIEGLRQGVIDMQQTDLNMGEGGGLWISHTVFYQAEQVLSVRLDYSYYVVGNAHPANWTHAVNYDPAAGRLLSLADLFLPGSDYLGVISRYCLADLSRQGVLDWEDGALPTHENYEPKWNVTDAGLLINFDTYAVSPGAAGPQHVVIPYSALAGVVSPGGPLATLLPQAAARGRP